MAAESAEGLAVFARAAQAPTPDILTGKTAIYTIARGSSDAAANILSYEIMREAGVPVTSLPPSVFSLGQGVRLDGAAALVISQSGGSEDLIRSANGARAAGATTAAITNVAGSGVEQAADLTVPINAGPELAIPATKTVIGAIGAGTALLSATTPDYAVRAEASAKTLATLTAAQHPRAAQVQSALLRARHVFVVGRDTGYGAAQEIALKLKECCAIHAEAYSASEVLHGPLQLATNPLMVLMLDTGSPHIQNSLDEAEARFAAAGQQVWRLRIRDVTDAALTPAAAAALLLHLTYPVILHTSIALGHDPDRPSTLAKVTVTR